MAEIAATLGECLGRNCGRSHVRRTIWRSIRRYNEGAVKFMRQVAAGRMGYIATVRDDVPQVTGRVATSFRAWTGENREALSPPRNERPQILPELHNKG